MKCSQIYKAILSEFQWHDFLIKKLGTLGGKAVEISPPEILWTVSNLKACMICHINIIYIKYNQIDISLYNISGIKKCWQC